MSDFIDRTLKLGYSKGSAILVKLRISILALWRFSEGSLSVNSI